MAWNIAKPGYTGQVSTISNPWDIFIKPDGLKMYITNMVSCLVYEYALSIAWDISTASHVRTEDISANNDLVFGVAFSPDGSKMYAIGNHVAKYTLSTPWDISSASYISREVTGTRSSIVLRDDGTMFYSTTFSGAWVLGYAMDPAWDITGAVVTHSFDIAADVTAGGSTGGLFISPDGVKMFITSTKDGILEYHLGTLWDISTAVYSRTYDIKTYHGITPEGLFFRPDGTSMYVSPPGILSVYEYELPSSKTVQRKSS